MQAARVLIVEDEFLIRMTLSETLVDDGFDVTEAESGDEALVLVGGPLGFDLLLTDVQLPGSLNGIALAAAARQQAPDLPVIFMTGRPDALADLQRPDFTVCISKPYLPSDVCAAARRLTGR